MDNNSQLIHRYLDLEMSADEIRDFEKRLTADPDLRKELMVQRQVMQALINRGIKNEFSIAIKKRVFTRNLVRLAIITGVAAVAFLCFALATGLFRKHTDGQSSGLHAAETYVFNNAADTVIETKEGVVFAIPAGAFQSRGEKVHLEIKTALTPQAIMENGLSTVSNGRLLQTGGMFYINGMEDGKPVPMVREIAVSIPAVKINPAMQLFDGVTDINGITNWVNPKPVERNLRVMDINNLDFYPPDYIPTLKALQKEYMNRRYTDSLYYSFSGYISLSPSEIESIPAPANESVTNLKDTSKINGDRAFYNDTDRIFTHEFNADSLKKPYYEIDPSRIRVLRDTLFANTFIATEEFAERVRYMHSLCTSRYLDIYLGMLDKPLYEADQSCADKSTGDVKKKFLSFAVRKNGTVRLEKGIGVKLNVYFQQKVKAYREAAQQTWAKYEQKLIRLKTIADEKRTKQAISDMQRATKNFEDEFCINLTNAYSQVGIKKTCRDTIVPPERPYYNITISTPGWKNLDIYVFDATKERESMSYTDPVTGKTAQLTYKEVNIRVENAESFEKVFVYLLPDSLSSFQRMPQQGDRFTEKLNSLFRYDALALAYKGADIYYYRQENLQPGAYTFILTSVQQEQLGELFKKYQLSKSTAIKKEWEYQLFERQEAIRQIQVRKDVEFRLQVAWSIFKCFLDGALVPAADVEKQLKYFFPL
jgi:hypothetical protein